jgi:predicted nucleotidyltransferase
MRRALTRDEVVNILKNEASRLRQRYGVTRMALFGSFAKGTAKRTSDIDLLVELERPLGFEFVALADDLEEILGRKVDLATFDCWKRSLTKPRYRSIAQDVERSLLYV